MTFTDTGGWFALFVAEDLNHGAATDWFTQNRQPLITTDYVIDETLTLLKARGQEAVALSLGPQFFSGSLATVYYLTEAGIRDAWQVFVRYSDKEWSFTDCTSKVVMGKLGLTQEFALP